MCNENMVKFEPFYITTRLITINDLITFTIFPQTLKHKYVLWDFMWKS